MIPGTQPKIPVTQMLTGTLVRESDQLSHTGRVAFVEWNENDGFKDLHPFPQVGYSIIIDPHRMDFQWLTTVIVSMEHFEDESKYVFHTRNSIYTLFYKINLLAV